MRSESILVVDDESDMRVAIKHVLKRSGYSVESAATGHEALDKFNNEKFSIVITDVKMPEMSGMEVLGQIKRISPSVPVIMMSAFGTIDLAVEAMQEGASDYIVKPFSFETIESAVKKVFLKSNCHNKESYEAGVPDNDGKQFIISQNTKLLELIQQARNVALSNAIVLIQGESGTGKEMLASFIHRCSRQSRGPYVAVNCAALPEGLAESELFGHEKGSFTGAVNRKAGKFESAHNGTIILDEISEMSISLQAKLLRVLQEKVVCRVGSSKLVPVNARVIAISNVDLEQAVQEGRFREDLFYRINVIPFTIPPLRERKDDIPLLVNHFLKKYSLKNNKKHIKISDEIIDLLLNYHWKGNIRELENTIERAVILEEGEKLLARHFSFWGTDDKRNKNIHFKAGLSLREMERELIIKTLKDANNNRTRTAKLLGISIRTLRNKLREYNEKE